MKRAWLISASAAVVVAAIVLTGCSGSSKDTVPFNGGELRIDSVKVTDEAFFGTAPEGKTIVTIRFVSPDDSFDAEKDVKAFQDVSKDAKLSSSDGTEHSPDMTGYQRPNPVLAFVVDKSESGFKLAWPDAGTIDLKPFIEE